MQDQLPVKSRDYLRTLNVLFAALVAGQIVFALVISLMNIFNKPVLIIPAALLPVLVWLVPAFAVLAVLMGWQVFRFRIKALQQQHDLTVRLQGYRAALLLRFAIMEGAGLLAIIIFYLSGSYIFLAVAAFIIVAFILNRPSKAKVIQHLNMQYDEQMKFDDGAEGLSDNTFRE